LPADRALVDRPTRHYLSNGMSFDGSGRDAMYA
jgi:hypothetical protein